MEYIRLLRAFNMHNPKAIFKIGLKYWQRKKEHNSISKKSLERSISEIQLTKQVGVLYINALGMWQRNVMEGGCLFLTMADMDVASDNQFIIISYKDNQTASQLLTNLKIYIWRGKVIQLSSKAIYKMGLNTSSVRKKTSGK